MLASGHLIQPSLAFDAPHRRVGLDARPYCTDVNRSGGPWPVRQVTRPTFGSCHAYFARTYDGSGSIIVEPVNGAQLFVAVQHELGFW